MTKKIIKDRFDYIKKYIKGKKVLNLGVVNGYKTESKYAPWFHRFVCKYSKEVIGLDLDKKNIPNVEKILGSKIHYGNIENYNLNEKFDVVIAGNIIEHISNFTGFFDSTKKHLKDNSILIITVPNAFNFSNIIRVLFKGQVVPDEEHTVFFDIFTLQKMLHMNGYKIIKHHYYTQQAPQRFRNIIIRTIGSIIPIYNLGLMVVVKKNS